MADRFAGTHVPKNQDKAIFFLWKKNSIAAQGNKMQSHNWKKSYVKEEMKKFRRVSNLNWLVRWSESKLQFVG